MIGNIHTTQDSINYALYNAPEYTLMSLKLVQNHHATGSHYPWSLVLH